LKDVFLDVPVKHLAKVLLEYQTLFKAYGIIDKQLRDYRTIRGATFSKIGKARTSRGTEVALIGRGSALPKELHAAKKKSERESGKWIAYIYQLMLMCDSQASQGGGRAES
jgi:TRIAD3 protein (E3 ubiquitin-protein ligase RNF216)